MQEIGVLWVQQLVWLVTMFFEYGITLSFFMEKKKWRIKHWVVAILFLSIIYSIVLAVKGPGNIDEHSNNGISVVLVGILLNVYYIGGLRKRVLAWCSAWALAGLTETIVLIILIKLGAQAWTVNYVFDTIFSWCVIPIFYLILDVIIVKIFKHTSLYYNDKNRYEHISYRYLVPIIALMGTIYFFSTTLGVGIAFGEYDLESKEITILLAYFMLCDVLLMMLMLYDNKRRHKRYIEQVELQYRNRHVQFYNRMGQLDIDTRRDQESISQQLQVIKRLSESKDMNKLIEELNQIEKLLTYEEGEPVVTGNTIVDAILSEKYHEAQKAHIHMTTKMSIPEKINMDLVDLCTIISGTVDTAINSAKTAKASPYIKIECLWIKGYILLKIEFNHGLTNEEIMKFKYITCTGIEDPISQPLRDLTNCVTKSGGLFEVNMMEAKCNLEITLNCIKNK